MTPETTEATSSQKRPGQKKARPHRPDRPTPRVRKMEFSFEGLPRHWFYGLPVPTHIANGLHMVFPAGERFFIRSVKHYLDRLADPGLKERVRAFFGQEGRHGHEHESAFEALESQGYEIQKFLRWYEKVAFGILEPACSPSLRLSTTVALEHFTACLAEHAITSDVLDGAHASMRDLLRWHAAEEIEHKSVAFDVFEEVDGRYWVRIAGLGVATACLLGFWTLATRSLLKQEKGLTREQIREQKKLSSDHGQDLEILKRAFVAYLRPGFHPDDHDDYHVARDYLVSVGRLEG